MTKEELEQMDLRVGDRVYIADARGRGSMHLYDIDAAAEYLGLGRETWLTHRKRGNAPQPAGKIGRSPYWTREQLDQWAKERTGRPGRPVTGTSQQP